MSLSKRGCVKLRHSSKLIAGVSVLLTTVAFHFASMLVFDRYPFPIKVVLISGWVVGGTLEIWGLIEERRLAEDPKLIDARRS